MCFEIGKTVGIHIKKIGFVRKLAAGSVGIFILSVKITVESRFQRGQQKKNGTVPVDIAFMRKKPMQFTSTSEAA